MARVPASPAARARTMAGPARVARPAKGRGTGPSREARARRAADQSTGPIPTAVRTPTAVRPAVARAATGAGATAPGAATRRMTAAPTTTRPTSPAATAAAIVVATLTPATVRDAMATATVRDVTGAGATALAPRPPTAATVGSRTAARTVLLVLQAESEQMTSAAAMPRVTGAPAAVPGRQPPATQPSRAATDLAVRVATVRAGPATTVRAATAPAVQAAMVPTGLAATDQVATDLADLVAAGESGARWRGGNGGGRGLWGARRKAGARAAAELAAAAVARQLVAALDHQEGRAADWRHSGLYRAGADRGILRRVHVGQGAAHRAGVPAGAVVSRLLRRRPHRSRQLQQRESHRAERRTASPGQVPGACLLRGRGPELPARGRHLVHRTLARRRGRPDWQRLSGRVDDHRAVRQD